MKRVDAVRQNKYLTFSLWTQKSNQHHIQTYNHTFLFLIVLLLWLNNEKSPEQMINFRGVYT